MSYIFDESQYAQEEKPFSLLISICLTCSGVACTWEESAFLLGGVEGLSMLSDMAKSNEIRDIRLQR